MTSVAFKAATRGQPGAVAEIRAMIEHGPAHAVLLAGPGSSGKTTLALDLAAGLLCLDPDPAARPCRGCRGCRLVESGNHPDLHRLAPEGPGGQVRIGDPRDPEPGTVRHLLSELALLPAEGGSRVAIVEQAHRLNEDAQNSLLKLLEEPPDGVTIVLCADDEELLLPTVRSRCVKIRLGVAGRRAIEAWLADLNVADAPAAARAARLAGGRPGLALAYARSDDAVRLRGEMARRLFDMLGMGRRDRLAAVRNLLKSAAELDASLAAARGVVDSGIRGREAAGAATRRRKGRPAAAVGDSAEDSLPGEGAEEAAGGKTPASVRRSAAATLVEVWASVARDLVVAQVGGARLLREKDLVDELRAAAAELRPGATTRFMERLAWVAREADANLNPELTVDVLALAWPRPSGVASGLSGPPAHAPAPPGAEPDGGASR
jgi:DNA polymerase-3 subunit delta'